MIRGTLKVDGKDYKPRIKSPDPTDVLKYTEVQLDAIFALDLNKGQKVTAKGSTFLAYTFPANSHLLVEQAYMRLAKEQFGSFKLPGSSCCRSEHITRGIMLVSYFYFTNSQQTYLQGSTQCACFWFYILTEYYILQLAI